MNFIEQVIGNTGNLANPISNPFTKDSIRSLSIYAYKSRVSGTIEISGTLKFEKGRTSGEQEFTGESCLDILRQMEEFYNNL